MKKLIDNNIDTFSIIHPYIHGVSDISFLKELSNLGIKQISFKGFRYNKTNMSDLSHYIPADVLDKYDNNEEETLIGGKYLMSELAKHNLEYIDLKEYVYNSLDSIYSSDRDTVMNKVKHILDKVVISSSEKNRDSLLDYIVKRRCK